MSVALTSLCFFCSFLRLLSISPPLYAFSLFLSIYQSFSLPLSLINTYNYQDLSIFALSLCLSTFLYLLPSLHVSLSFNISLHLTLPLSLSSLSPALNYMSFFHYLHFFFSLLYHHYIFLLRYLYF